MLTDLTIRQMKTTGGQQEQAVGGVAGLTIRTNQGGTKTFFLAFRVPATGKTARMRLGEYHPKHFTLERARSWGGYTR